MKMLHKTAFVLLIIGGLNWLLAAFHYDIGQYLPWGLVMIIYILIGLAAIYEVVGHKKMCRSCNPSGGGMGMQGGGM